MLHAFVNTFITSTFIRCMPRHYNQMSINTATSSSNQATRNKVPATISKENDGLKSCIISLSRHVSSLQRHFSWCCRGSFLGAFQNCENSLLATSSLSIRPPSLPLSGNNSGPTRQIFLKFDIWRFFENLAGKFKLSRNLALTHWGRGF